MSITEDLVIGELAGENAALAAENAALAAENAALHADNRALREVVGAALDQLHSEQKKADRARDTSNWLRQQMRELRAQTERPAERRAEGRAA